MGARARDADEDGGRLSWELACAPPGSIAGPDGLDRLSFRPAVVPGTVAAALGPDVDLDGQDWWFRGPLPPAGDDGVLVLDGVATVADVWVNGEHVAHSDSMFMPVRVDLGGRLRAGGGDELVICCRALAPLLAERRKPRARWRTALVSEGNLRFFRTMLLGRAPGFAPGPAAVGPFAPVRVEPRGVPQEVRARTSVTPEGEGILRADLCVRASVDRLRLRLSGPTGVHEAELKDGRGELRVPSVARWWPHTHGQPALYELSLLAGDELVHASRVGFRSLEWPDDWEQRGLALRINGVEVFCRGAVWTPASLELPFADSASLRATLTTVRDAGMNMLRIPGITCYESDQFHDLCDELGILVWQDFMFANLDYPDGDAAFVDAVEQEARFQLGRLAGRPSLSVLCGGSECAQQVTMLGLDPELARGPLYTEILPRLVPEAGADVPYIPNAPWGGSLPFRPAPGVANYYGVGAYRRPLSDARLARVSFAAECLAFSNVPDEEALSALAGGASAVPAPHTPAWKAGIPRDAGAGWDFEDVRDHYLRLLYGVDPVELRWTDPERYRELGRHATGEVMAETFGEWRRSGSPCAGALVLWLRDLAPGAGWGLIDDRGAPKAALGHLRRVLAPVAVWTTDEGLAGIAVHVANDGAEELVATLRIALYRDFETCVEQALVPLAMTPRSVASFDVEETVGRFVDVNWSYRFGPPAQDLVVASLEQEGRLVSQAFRFPVGRPHSRESADRLGLEAGLLKADDGGWGVSVGARRAVHCVRLEAPGYKPTDDAFSLEPGVARMIGLRPAVGVVAPPSVTVTALNLRDRLRVASE